MLIKFLIGFIVWGMFCGFFGFAIAALMQAASRADDEMLGDKQYKE